MRTDPLEMDVQTLSSVLGAKLFEFHNTIKDDPAASKMMDAHLREVTNIIHEQGAMVN
jgi:hypothetical protein